MTNREVMQAHRPPLKYPEVCEYEPLKKRPARLGDAYHGLAEVVVGKVSKELSRHDNRLKVCSHCKSEAEVYLQRSRMTPDKVRR